MKKAVLLALSLVLVLALSVTGLAEKNLSFRMADNQADGTPNVEGDKKFIELVEQYTNGTVTIELHNNAVLGDETSCADMLQLDTLDLCRISTNGIAPTCNAFNVFSLPYVFASDEAKYAALDGEFGETLTKTLLDETGLVNRPPLLLHREKAHPFRRRHGRPEAAHAGRRDYDLHDEGAGRRRDPDELLRSVFRAGNRRHRRR